MQESISISKFKATCLAVLQKVQQTGQSVLVTKHGKAVAQVIPPDPPRPRKSWLGSMPGEIHGDIVSPLDEEWEVLQ